jgi:hypothetical protein
VSIGNANTNEKANQPFVIPARVCLNGLAIKTEALCDTGAFTKLLIRPEIALQAQKSLGAKLEKMATPISLSDYRNNTAGKITHRLTATFELDGRRFKHQTFLVTDCGHDIFIGQRWLADQDIWIHPRTRQFDWPDVTW